MFILNPDPYLLPTYRISPFTTHNVSCNHTLPDSDFIDEYFKERFAGKSYSYTKNGRQALDIALDSLNLGKNDVVTIITTSGNFYISSCVTNSIEKHCRWSRVFEKRTRAILVNHEFGYPYPGLRQLKEYNLPIIEDCASSFFSHDDERSTGEVGDFVVFSFPKMFPLQIGGLLVSSDPGRLEQNGQLGRTELRHIKNVLSSQIPSWEKIIGDRISNYLILRDKFATLGFLERFALGQGIVPGVFMFRTGGMNIDLAELKKHFYAHGIQCGVFYNEEAFFIPVHQALGEEDLDYFFHVLKSFLQ
jgi:hypothetical protein